MITFKELLNMLGVRHVDEEEYPSIDDKEFREKVRLRYAQSQEEIPLPAGWSK